MAEWRRLTSAGRITGAVSFRAIYRVPIAKSDGLRERNRKLWGLEFPCGKPDIDNLCKMYLDCLTEIAYTDDRQIVALNAIKVYSLRPRTEIEVMALEGPTLNEKSEKILEMFGPADFADLVECCEDIHCITYDSDALEGVADAVDLENIASAILRMALTHGKALAKIAKTFPDEP